MVKGQLGEGEGRGGCGRPPPSPHRFMWDKTDKKLLIHMSMIINSDDDLDDLSLEKSFKMCNLKMLIRSVIINENRKYPQVFLVGCLHKLIE